MHMKIPYTRPSIGELEVQFACDAALNVCGDNHNRYVTEFEGLFKTHLGVDHAIATSSCTGALHMGLSALGVGPDDEVIMADTNWVATAAPVVQLGARPVFVDILPDSLCLDPAEVKRAISEKTKAIIAVHLYGNLCEMDRLLEIGKQYGVPVIEDAAEAIGSTYKGRPAGSLGFFGVFSFHGSKTVTTGEGGMFVTNDADLNERVLTLSNHGRSRDATRMFWPEVIGFKYKMGNIQAAIGCAQMQRISTLVERKREILSSYIDEFNKADIQVWGFNTSPPGCETGAWMPTVVLATPSVQSNLATRIQSALRQDHGIDMRPFFAPLSSTPPFMESQPPDTAERWAYKIPPVAMNLPSFHDMSNDHLKLVVHSIKEHLSR
ncbi:MAG: DegT/DnrJ/EryC1/StrS family aminotransferase [Ilumatobacteraceae bacterium]